MFDDRTFAKVAYSTRNFDDRISRCFSVNFAKSSFSDVLWYGVKRIKSIFADKGNSATRSGAPFYCLK